VEGDVSVKEGRGLGGEECLCGLAGVRWGLLTWGVDVLGRSWTVVWSEVFVCRIL